MNPRKLVIGVSGINAGDNPAPGVGVAKSLKAAAELDATVIGLAYDAMEPGIYLEGTIDRAFLVPYPAAGQRALVERLLYIRGQVGLDLVIPTLDSEIPIYRQACAELAAHGIRCFLPEPEQFALRDKIHLRALAHRTGMDAPRQAVVVDGDSLLRAAVDLGYPVMVKGAMYGAYRAENAQEALARFSAIAAEWGYPVLVQELAAGEEMNVIGVGDGEGGAPGLVAIKKLSTTRLGKIWTGVTVDHPGLLEAARRFCEASRWRGAFELECMVAGDRVQLIEVNPRFPAWVYFATGVGVNLPAMLVRYALDGPEPGSEPRSEPVPEADPYPAGRLYVRYTEERICDMHQFQNMVTRGEA